MLELLRATATPRDRGDPRNLSPGFYAARILRDARDFPLSTQRDTASAGSKTQHTLTTPRDHALPSLRGVSAGVLPAHDAFVLKPPAG